MSEPVNFIMEHYDNEKLTEANEQLASIVARLQAENAKLKSLVRHMHTCMDHVEGFGVYCDCDNCVFDGTCECDFEERIRELGIEVEA